MKFFRRDFLKRLFYGILGLSGLGGTIGVIMNEMKEKQIKYSYKVNQKQWVGDGFHVHPLLRPSEELTKYISPFILMDYASPKEFPSSSVPKGVGEHPHRGFETVTFAYQGEVQHRDSSGGGGIIKEGDVQWMTAGRGVVHDEFHSEEFTKDGGIFEMVQLWVNLPKKDKMTTPKYQSVKNENIPNIKTGKQANVRVIAGEFNGNRGPASTFTPINIYDISSEAQDQFNFELKDGSNTVLLILRGEAKINQNNYNEQSVLIFDRTGEDLKLETSENFKALLLNGDPIDEPMVAHGPFVMNTREEISEAIRDFQNGKMGQL